MDDHVSRILKMLEEGKITATEAQTLIAALKTVLSLRGVPVREDVRRPLRTLAAEERETLEGIVEEFPDHFPPEGRKVA